MARPVCSADQPHPFARANDEVEVVEHAFVVGAAVGERKVLEADLAVRNLELARIGVVDQRMRHSNGLHAFLHDADVFEDAGHFPAHPAGHVGDLPGQRQRGRHDWLVSLFADPNPYTSFFLAEIEERVMLKLTKFAVQFLRNEDGPTAVEYAVMLALIIVVCLTAIQAVGTNANAKFNQVQNALT